MTVEAGRTRPSVIRFDRDAILEPLPPIPAEEVLSGSPVQRGRAWIEEPSLGLEAGIWACTPQISTWMDYPVNEFMLVLEGEITIVEADRETTFGPGDAFVLPKGLSCQWRQESDVRKFYVIFDDGSGAVNPGPLHAIRVDPAIALDPSTPPGPDVLVSGTPVQATHEWFVDATGQFAVGVWATTAYHRRAVPSARYELMHIIRGETVIADADGQGETFRAGETLLVPLGAEASWHGEGDLRKIYCLFQPAG